jgi:hypothetical protein
MVQRTFITRNKLGSMESNCKVRCTTKRKADQTCVNAYVNKIDNCIKFWYICTYDRSLYKFSVYN